MRLTIIKSDGTVIVDGHAIIGMDLSFLPKNVHAVQWYDTYGEVEIKNEYGKVVENIAITSIEPYQQAIDLWQITKIARELEEAKAAADRAAAANKG
jgi:hypothetical protein